MRELMIGSTELVFQTGRILAYVLPLVCLLAIAVHVWPGRFAALGTSAARTSLVAVMWGVWLFAAVGFFLLYYVSQNYDRSYGFGFIPFAIYMGPSLILSVICLVLRYKSP